ncbi:long-chain-fatty-acid--CoA ligase ACSBG1-like [Sinocyclocheilus grahami]|uniref:long-chain-fatty-acid--CoA ligase ACSBG1-like n=1 Tax=Sinocyclocheilus grahami TaxID=75366 RepID=UPI0007AC6474|nr:PREDICTED: long-chain-fatty-acid--CoA ligase ACSBG1-like [Sinocyclocheilus grahami]
MPRTGQSLNTSYQSCSQHELKIHQQTDPTNNQFGKSLACSPMTDLMQQDVGNGLSEKTSIEEVLAGAELAPAQSLWTKEVSGSVQLRMDELCPEHPITVHQMFTNSVQKYGKLTALASKRGNKGIMAGIYTTNSPDACLYVANVSRANIIVVENQKQLDKILEVKDKLNSTLKSHSTIFWIFEGEVAQSLFMGRVHGTRTGSL